MPDFKDLLSEFCGEHMEEHGVGAISAELQNLAADLISECDDKEFRDGAIKTFSERVHQNDH